MNYKNREKYQILGMPEYDIGFWDYMSGRRDAENTIREHRNTLGKGGYALPAISNTKYNVNVKEKNIFRNIATVHLRHDASARLWLTNSDELADFVDENAKIPIKDMASDFTRTLVGSHKLIVFFKIANDMKANLGLNFGDYMLKKLATCFGRTEDKAYITCTGVKEPKDILHRRSRNRRIGKQPYIR